MAELLRVTMRLLIKGVEPVMVSDGIATSQQGRQLPLAEEVERDADAGEVVVRVGGGVAVAGEVLRAGRDTGRCRVLLEQVRR